MARQSEPRFRCIVVDDGSSDGTAEIARGMAARDRRFELLGLAHGGLVCALRAGLARARAPFVARMDADDVMRRERMALQLRALEADPGLAGVGCHVRLFPRRASGEGMQRYERWLNAIESSSDVARERFIECPIAHPTLLIRREVLQTFGYRDAGWAEDYDLVLRLLESGQRLSVVPRRLLAWRDGPERTSRTAPAYGLEAMTRCKAWFLAHGFLADVERYVLWGYGGTGKALARALAACGKRPSHIVELHPGRLGQRIAGAEVVPPAALERLRPPRMVVSVAGPEARGQIRAALRSMGFREGGAFVCAA